MKEDIKLTDMVIEIIDARIPVSSRNPDIDSMAQNKSRVVVLNKEDFADPKATEEWISYFEEKGFIAAAMNAKTGNGMKAVKDAIARASAAKIERDRKRGILNRPVRAMICGIPNVGKSTFINAFAGRAVAKTGNKPGVTRGKQWIRLNKQVELLDTPGILWPKFDDKLTALHLAFIGSFKDEIVEKVEVVTELKEEMDKSYPGILEKYYGLEGENTEISSFLTALANKRGFLLKGGEPDITKAASLVLDDMKNGRTGRITLEKVNDGKFFK
jgi:ribosome biogenesis GTPase A